MKFTDIFIKRPVLSCVISILILVFGIHALSKLSLRQYPKMENTVITITTTYPGANSNLMQGFITAPIEKAIAGADGLDYITATSTQSMSVIKAYIKLNFPPNDAFTSIMSKVAQVKNDLPEEAEEPVIQKDTGSQIDLMYIGFNSEKMSAEQITDYLTRVVQPKLETIPGVAKAEILGDSTFAMRIWLEPNKMAALNTTPTDIGAALRNKNFLSAAGTTKGEYVAYNINASTNLHTKEEFGNIVIKNDGNSLVHLRDVAKIELGAQNYDSYVTFNGKKAIFIGVDSTPTANPLRVITDVKKALPDLEKNYPSSLEGKVVYDATEYIRASIHEVIRTIAEATVIVILVIFLFLNSLRSVLIPVVTIPLSLIGVCSLMLILGYSINLLTLLAMVLAIGLVVDDAIVVVENIHRLIEEGMSPLEASLRGARQIALPIIAMTITLAAVYAPIGFMSGITGTLFKEFAFTLAATVIISGVIALTLSPMMCSMLLKPHQNTSQGILAVLNANYMPYRLAYINWYKTWWRQKFRFWPASWNLWNILKSLLALALCIPKFFFWFLTLLMLDNKFDRFKNWYEQKLNLALIHRSFMVITAILVLTSCYFLYANTQKELAPEEDQSVLFVSATAPQYANIDYVTKFTEPFNEIYSNFKETKDFFVLNGMGAVNNVISGLILKPWNQRNVSQKQLNQLLQDKLGQIAGLQTVVFPLPSLPSAGDGLPIEFVITTINSDKVLFQYSQKILEAAQRSGLFLFVDNSLKFNRPEIVVNMNREKASELGVNMQEIGGALALAFGGNNVNRFSMDGKSYQVIPQVGRNYRANPEQINNIYIHTDTGQTIPLGTIASIARVTTPNSLAQFNQLNSATIQGLMMPGHSIGEALNFLIDESNKILPKGFSYDFGGQSRQFITEGNVLVYTFFFAILIIFLVLSAQFESFRDPFIILVSVPMSICGALIFLNIGFASINIYTQIGLITLIGLISKHGILMVDFANHLQIEKGLDKVQAIATSAVIRLRPILMTTASMVLGVVPLLLASGAGAVSRFDIGLVIASGMLIGTMFTLFVVPTMYTFFASDKTIPSQKEGNQGSHINHEALK